MPKDSANILDIGCGIGYGVVFGATLGKNVIGVDLSKSVLHRATPRTRQRNVRNLIDFVRCSVTDLPLRSGSFDCVFCILLVDAFEKLERLLTEIEVLNKGGKLIVADLDSTAFSMMTLGKIVQFWDKRSGYPYWLHSLSVIEEMLLNLDLTSVKKQRRRMGLSPPIYVVEARKA